MWAVPILSPLLVGIGIADSTSALVTYDKNFKELSAQVDIDLSHLENFVSCLENCVSCLDLIS